MAAAWSASGTCSPWSTGWRRPAPTRTAIPGLCFLAVPEGKTIKNRLHIDLDPDDRDAEVERLVALGATRADVGQGAAATWAVLADPEGNEFCVLRPHRSLIG